MRMLLLISLTAFATGSAAQAQVNPADVKWGAAPPAIPKGAEMAVLSGDPAKDGIFVFRVKMPAGYVVPPHNHAKDEHVTVISGGIHLGMGDTLQKPEKPNLVEGGFITTKAGMNHSVYSPGGATIQVMGQGPFTITYVNPKDDPRNAAAPEKSE